MRRTILLCTLAAAIGASSATVTTSLAAHSSKLSLQARVSRLEKRVRALALLIAAEPAPPAPASLMVDHENAALVPDGNGNVYGFVYCPPGENATGGGASVGGGVLFASTPTAQSTGWAAVGRGTSGTVYVECSEFSP